LLIAAGITIIKARDAEILLKQEAARDEKGSATPIYFVISIAVLKKVSIRFILFN
jgi:hypothetical protein